MALHSSGASLFKNYLEGKGVNQIENAIRLIEAEATAWEEANRDRAPVYWAKKVEPHLAYLRQLKAAAEAALRPENGGK